MTQTLEPTSTLTAETFDSLDPASGELVGTFPVDDAARVAEVVELSLIHI